MHLLQLIEQKTIVAISIQTSGTDIKRDYIVSVGAVKLAGWVSECAKDDWCKYDKVNISSTFMSFVRCPLTSPQTVRKNIGISDETLKNALSTDNVLARLKEFTGSSIILAYNADYVCGFLNECGNRHGISFDNRRLDVAAIAKSIFRDKVKNYELSALAYMFGIEYDQKSVVDESYALAKLLGELALRDDEAHCKY